MRDYRDAMGDDEDECYTRHTALQVLDTVAVFDNTVFRDDDRVWCTISHPKDELLVRVFVPHEKDSKLEVQLFNHIDDEVVMSEGHTVVEIWESSVEFEYYLESKIGEFLRDWREIVL